ncbi:hypothetical protein PGT21_024001 [Puccinia graminis f. sp. tritici]|uniref:Uncharacterized protein n=1 Tax=Puccinia graminis f. sp. tritici TaxID=56615 RepID=A0A5B0NX05_PUCGR|nr:hypothetical protein PGT21_024001 [Puccinia graminis f. sp. tritici]KAA1092308.1 hypothetical protein PGTUg99_017449 [Puccinia graminis f. sp. tritici]
MVDFSSPPTHPEPVLTHHPSSTLYRQVSDNQILLEAYKTHVLTRRNASSMIKLTHFFTGGMLALDYAIRLSGSNTRKDHWTWSERQ